MSLYPVIESGLSDLFLECGILKNLFCWSYYIVLGLLNASGYFWTKMLNYTSRLVVSRAPGGMGCAEALVLLLPVLAVMPRLRLPEPVGCGS